MEDMRAGKDSTRRKSLSRAWTAVEADDLWAFLIRSRVRGALRGQPAGSASAGRAALRRLKLSDFGRCTSQAAFNKRLDKATTSVRHALASESWGWARKCINMCLRDALYNVYLRAEFDLGHVEPWAELPLDNEVAARLRQREPDLPGAFAVSGVTPAQHARFQTVATRWAEELCTCRVHLDILIWK